MEILIIGLDRVGASIGLALGQAELEVTRTGYDENKSLALAARQIHAIDQRASNLARAARSAPLIVLNVMPPLATDYLRDLARQLEPGTVILDTACPKRRTIAWAHELLGVEVHYMGATPIGCPNSLDFDTWSGDETPRADLFQGGLLALVASPRAPMDAVNVAIAFGEALGASPFFLDGAEMDSMAAAVVDLPKLLGLALMTLASEEPNWRDIQKVADRSFALATLTAAEAQPEVLASELILNQDYVLLRLNSLLEKLRQVRAHLEEGDSEALSRNLGGAVAARQAWLDARQRGDWQEQAVPSTKFSRRGILDFLLNLRGPEDKR